MTVWGFFGGGGGGDGVMTQLNKSTDLLVNVRNIHLFILKVTVRVTAILKPTKHSIIDSKDE